MFRILVAEDDRGTQRLMQDTLADAGYEPILAADGQQALELLACRHVDLMVVDVMMPRLDGFALLSRLRRSGSQMPVLILTAKEAQADKRQGLRLGADDYMIKPFDSKELVARVKAVLRRYQPTVAPATQPAGKYVEYPDLAINLTNYSVIYRGKAVDMPPKELELLYFLASSPNQVFTREQLLDHIWGYEYIGDTRTVDVHIKRLREKIKDHETWSISTVWGIGYKFEVKTP